MSCERKSSSASFYRLPRGEKKGSFSRAQRYSDASLQEPVILLKKLKDETINKDNKKD